MNVYVGMDVHRKRSQIAVLDAVGDEQRTRNVPNDPAKLVPILGALAPGTPVAFEASNSLGSASSSAGLGTASVTVPPGAASCPGYGSWAAWSGAHDPTARSMCFRLV